MGAVDQRDVKSHIMSLTRSMVSKWHQKQLYFLVETAISGAHCNYNLDAGVKPEFFKEWHTKLVHELLSISKNYRKRKMREIEMTPAKKVKRSHKKKTPASSGRKRKKCTYGLPTKAGLSCYGRENLTAFLDLFPLEGTAKNKRPSYRRLRCKFCGRERVMYRCSACGEVFCMLPPYDLIIPESNPPRKFVSNGLFCWQLIHGYKSKTQMRG